jgi:hypothetical protein
VASLEGKSGGSAPAPAPKAEPAKPAADEDDDDVDLFGSDDEEEDAEAARVRCFITRIRGASRANGTKPGQSFYLQGPALKTFYCRNLRLFIIR